MATTNKSDLELIKEVKEKGCDKSFNELNSRYGMLCYKIFHRYAQSLRATGFTLQDFDKEKDYILFQSIIKYDSNKSKFITFVGRNVMWSCKKRITEHIKLSVKKFEPIHEQEIIDDSWSTSQDNSEFFEFVNHTLNGIKDKRVKEIYEMRYFTDKKRNLPWKIIADKFRISIQQTINLHNSGQRLLKEKFYEKQQTVG